MSLVRFGKEPCDQFVEVLRESYRLVGILTLRSGTFKGGEIGLLVDEVLYLIPDVTIGREGLKDQEHDDSQRHHPEEGMIRQGGGLLAGAVLLQEPGAVGPEFDLKNHEPAGLAELRRRGR